MALHGQWSYEEPTRQPLGISRRFYAQGIVTVSVLLAGIGLSVSGASSDGSASASPAPASPASVSSPAPAPSPTYLPPDPNYKAPPPGPSAITPHHARAPRPVTHVSWSRLLPKTPAGWRLVLPAAPLTATALSQEFAIPSAVRNDLSFDGYERGVKTEVRGPHVGDVEEFWQFARRAGATSWLNAVVRANQPVSNHDIKRSYMFDDYAFGYTGAKIDGSGYHYGVGIEAVGTLVIHVRVFGVAPITELQLHDQLRRVARRVEAAGPVRVGRGGIPSTSNDSTTNT